MQLNDGEMHAALLYDRLWHLMHMPAVIYSLWDGSESVNSDMHDLPILTASGDFCVMS